MNIIFIKKYLSYKIDTVFKNANITTAQRLISLGVCEELKEKPLKKKLGIKTK